MACKVRLDFGSIAHKGRLRLSGLRARLSAWFARMVPKIKAWFARMARKVGIGLPEWRARLGLVW